MNDIFFLGICERASVQGSRVNVLGLTRIMYLPFFPQDICDLPCIMAIKVESMTQTQNIKIVFTESNNADNTAWRDYSIKAYNVPQSGIISDKSEMNIDNSCASPVQYPDYRIITFKSPPLKVWHPCRVNVEVNVNGETVKCGEMVFLSYLPPPLSEEERRAISSRPNAIRYILFKILCRKCKKEAYYYTQLEPTDLPPPEIDFPPDTLPLKKAPDQWSCECPDSTKVLTYLKNGAHEIFRHHSVASSKYEPIKYISLYESDAIHKIIQGYKQTISNSRTEEPIQKYIEKYPIMWSFLSLLKIFNKPPILASKKADFGVLTTGNVLYFIEIEKPKTQLITKSGKISADIQRGADQIRDWQGIIDDHKLAVLSELGLNVANVHDIRYILVVGLARRTKPEGLSKIRNSQIVKDTNFYCFDELASFLHGLSRDLRNI